MLRHNFQGRPSAPDAAQLFPAAGTDIFSLCVKLICLCYVVGCRLFVSCGFFDIRMRSTRGNDEEQASYH